MEVAARQIGPWRLGAELGRGGMGIVYEAVHADSGARAAVKTVRGGSSRARSAARLEFRALSSLRHPGIVRVLDHGEEAGAPWLAMERVDGPSLRTRCHALASTGRVSVARDPSTWIGTESLDPVPETAESAGSRLVYPAVAGGAMGRVATLVRRLCAPLAYLHGEGRVHRDLKPDNVLVRSGDRPVLLDFGLLARFCGAVDREALELQARAGTPRYMSPEQARGELVDARTDLYALGCILFELVAGTPPFVGSAHEVLVCHAHLQPPPLSAFVEVPAVLDDLVARLLTKDPVDRLGHVDEVAEVMAELGAEDEAGEPGAPILFRPTLCGRTGVLRRATEALDETGTVVILGESGSGKTRIALESAAVAARGRRLVITGTCRPRGGPLHGLAPVLQLVADRCADRPDLVPSLLGWRAAILARYEPSLARFADGAHGSSATSQERVVEAVVATVTALADSRPTTVLVDDLQWADELTEAVLERLVAGVPGLHLAMLTRSEERTPAIEALTARVPVVKLDRLDDEAIGSIAAQMLAVRQVDDVALVGHLVRNAGGNPLFVAAWLHAAVEAGQLVRRDGRWVLRAGVDLDAVGLPDTLVEVLGRRLDGLPTAARALADAAAVLGRIVEPDLAAEVAGLSEAATLDATAVLLRRHVWEDDGGQLRFHHDKLHEVARAVIADPRAAHRRAAEVVDRRHPERHAVLAGLWRAAGVPLRASQAARLAGAEAQQRYAQRDARVFFDAALADAGTDDGLRARAHHSIGSLLTSTGHRTDAEPHLEATVTFAAAGGEVLLAAEGRAQLAEVYRFTGRHAEAEVVLLEVVDVLRDVAPGAASRAMSVLGLVYTDHGRLDEGARWLSEACVQARATDEPRRVAHAVGMLGGVHYARGHLRDALAAYAEAAEVLHGVGDRAGYANYVANRGLVELVLDEIASAAASARAALVIARPTGDRWGSAYYLGYLGLALQAGGEIEAARTTLLESADILAQLGDPLSEGVARIYLAHVLLDLDDTDAAEVALARATETLGPHPDPRRRASLVNARARLLRRLGTPAPELIDGALAELGDNREPAVMIPLLVERGRLGHDGDPWFGRAVEVAEGAGLGHCRHNLVGRALAVARRQRARVQPR